ncbi:TetR/AcrR family transcriptional regulator [Microbispora amethystogenes]|uniref:HTH-type transcriptional regulator EthR n=1 Tax=Microbispora amethystogenes TaxID=1427754 RepID=A0ABQ4F8S2_9ACTN|nr:TetR/AcrR family transcriptional regulator [Microbispora amethystogenes]GIH31214.1 HTH-type transcriptional regulator EthR [Microbispora amethystogenes]
MPSKRGAQPARRSVAEPASTGLRERILSATRDLLRERRFETLSVADILTAAGVSRASFYFYFPSRQAVLGELVREAVTGGRRAARPWTGGTEDPVAALRAGVRDGARLWRDNAGVLTAIVESQGSDEGLRALWHEQMGLFTDAAAARIEADPQARARLGDLDVRAVAASLTWMGERLYYLAAAGVPPFDDEEVLVDVLTHAWTSMLYGPPDAPPPAVRHGPAD